MAATASAAHFDVIPGGTISVNNTSGQTLGSMVNGNLGWADVATGSKVFNFDNVVMAKLEGEITEMVGERLPSWAGSWGTIGITDYDWIDGKYVNDPGIPSPNSYKIGWIQNSSLVPYTGGTGTYGATGARMVLEDTRSIGADGYSDVADTMQTDGNSPAFAFKMEWDMSAYDPANKPAGGGLVYLDYKDKVLDTPWYSELNGIMFPSGGQPIGVMHGTWDTSDPNYYDINTQAVIAISLVEDNTGYSASYTYSDIVFDVVGRIPGDANLDGVVDQTDLDIVLANMGSTNAHWGMGDFTGGGIDDWGGLDGVVDELDLAIVQAALGLTIPGDLNGDGAVNSGDLDIVRGNWGISNATGPLQGDANGDGFVNSADLDIVRANWGTTAPAVPEPGFLMLAAAGLLALALRRR